ncbi:MAG: TIGR02757 family protein [Flavobacteriales bacterium]|nr:TIGR02757 family protein [Flavobacteriales bacterium]
MARRTVRSADLRSMLDEAYDRYARPEFVRDDPIQIPKGFDRREDAEVIGFLTATIAWGQRKTIITNARKMAQLMDGAPHDFVLNATDDELARLDGFVHRTFNSVDLLHFVIGLRHVYAAHGGLERAFLPSNGEAGDRWSAAENIPLFRARFFEPAHQPRTRKHVADPSRGSNAKRINMFLRWMVRPAERGVDLGLWNRIRPADLMVPLDVHTGRVARAFGLLERSHDDWKSVEELTQRLREFDPSDPVKYDIALFGLGVSAR